LNDVQLYRQELIDKLEARTIRMPSGCWVWQGACSGYGYGHFTFRSHNYITHRLSYALFKGPLEDGIKVRHDCDNPPCWNPAHLLVGTQADNMRDMSLRGRSGPTQHPQRYRGENHGGSKLTEARVVELLRLYERDKMSMKDIAEKFGVSRATVSHIINGRLWTHLTDTVGLPESRRNTGSTNGQSKVNEAIVSEIRRRYTLGDISQRALALEFNVTQQLISRIVRGERWADTMKVG
jgi:predicted XRE-type DNA-binding protein